MWYGLRSLKTDADFASSANELLESTSRTLIVATASAYLAWHMVGTVLWPGTLGERIWLNTFIVAATAALSLWLLPKHLLLAQAVWQLGLAVVITLSIYLFQEPALSYFYTLLPFMAVVTTGWPAGLLSEILLGSLVWCLSRSLRMPLATAHLATVIAGGAFTVLLGWSATHVLLTVTRWSASSYEQARKHLEEARDQRMELKQAQEDLVQANRELARLSDRLKAMVGVAEEARHTKEHFVANVSHEMRTPLNMIIGFSEIITHSPQVYGGSVPPKLLADISIIRHNSLRLAKLVNDVLDLSQVEAGRMVLHKEWTSVQEIVGEATDALQFLFDSKGLYLESELAPGLPPVFCDSTRISQVLTNLLSNAGRFTERGGVRIKAWQEEDAVVISVADTGPGIASEQRQTVFEPFQQLDRPVSRRHEGSGLGLSISRRFVEMHGGKIWVESEVGTGTTFYFSLPLETPPPAILAGVDDVRRWLHPNARYEPRTRRSRAPAPDAVPRYVLLEEEDTLQRLFRGYEDDVEIVSVQNVEQARQALIHSPAQALIVNAIPDEYPALANHLGDVPYGTPVMTCWVPGESEAARQLGVAHYLVKPVSRETLLSALGGLGGGVRDVLLVDDQPDVLHLFTRMLSSAERDYRVIRAANGQRALGLLRQRQPDVMLLDLIMPGMDGFQVLREKSQDPTIREIPVIVVSSRDPSNEPVVSDVLAVSRPGGLTVRDLLACVRAISGILSPSVRLPGPGQPESPVA